MTKINKEEAAQIIENQIIDTLEIARQKFPGAQNSLDALCKRFNIDNSKREKHSALVDCNLLKEVYVNLVDQKEPKLNLDNSEFTNFKIDENALINKKNTRKIIKLNKNELEMHKNYLKTQLQKNYFD